MDGTQQFIGEIEAFCARQGMAESTFGFRAANDGKFVSRLRNGRRVTTATVDKVRAFIAAHGQSGGDALPGTPGNGAPEGVADVPMKAPTTTRGPSPLSALEKQRAFRFYDNRQKYLLFVHTCGEKWVVADRVGMELAHLQVTPPALRVFDAGMGDGTVLIRALRQMHRRFPTVPFYVVAKEISLEDVRLSLEKMPDRFFEHPAMVFVVTNLYYSEAPSLMPRNVSAAASLNWREVALSGNTAHEFERQITELQHELAEGWKVHASGKTGNPLYDRPSVLILYREDHKVLLDQVIPRPGQARGQYDLIIASQPFRARMPLAFKVDKVLKPLAEALAPGGRMLTVYSHGRDPGLRIIQRIWPNENPFLHDRHQLLHHMKEKLGRQHRDLTFKAYADKRAIFRYQMHTLPTEIGDNIGTSTLLAAWNAAIYVAQIEDERLQDVMGDLRYLQATRDVLQEFGGLWFLDESFVVTRRRH
ncbi:MAG: hypothetical protein HY342_01945 [Candidatus Lambdaproteobacteria bacterium]|nr:hypothetical protein [Candidatus Lambdaproteobacteria bacterium]